MRPDSAPETAFADSIDEIVAALDQDPVLVEEVMGNGQTIEVREALRDKAEQVSVPVYVVLTKAPPGLTSENTAEELLTLLHAETGWDGVWHVTTSDVGHSSLAVYGEVDLGVSNAETNLSMARFNARDEATEAIRDECPDCSASAAVEAGLVLDILASGVPEEFGTHPLTDAQIDSYATSLWSHPESRPAGVDQAEMPTAGLTAMVATVTAMVVAVVGYRLVQAIGGKAHPRIGAPPPSAHAATETDPAVELARWQAEAAAEVRRLERQLARTKEHGHRRDIATACLERAETRTAAGDLLEVVGALVLARTGLQALRAGRPQYRCCYIDPRHGAAQRDVPLGGGARVPVCDTCAGDLARGSEPAALIEVIRFAPDKPYYQGSTVWARTGFGALGGEWWQEVPR